jgi:hypothetical protein
MAASVPAEASQEHTRILRVMLVTEDCVAYWHAPRTAATGTERTRVAFEQRWFGSKSEPRVKTLLGDMALRFDTYPAALAALRTWEPPRAVCPWVCHFHTQLADPIYRRFAGEFLPKRRQLGYSTVDREVVARWVQEEWSGKWSPSTCVKFGSNMLATAYEAGLLKDRTDPRKLGTPRPPRQAIEYLLYLLREVQLAGSILASPYLRSVAPESESLEMTLRGLDSVRLQSIGDLHSFEWAYPDLSTWAKAQNSAELRGATA